MPNLNPVEELENRIDELAAKDRGFAHSLCSNYHRYGSLSDKQMYWVKKLLSGIGGDAAEDGKKEQTTEEVFDGSSIQSLLLKASTELKFPKLRYQTDGRSKVVFSYVADSGSKWHRCTFIDNGGRENKKRYGFIANNGSGRINRDAPPEIKALIRAVAKDPVNVAKLSGQKYSNCCFCGLELTNKSSIHHGYGPICASNWGLPWGDTGDPADEEAAAKEELKHIQLQDLE